MNVFPHEKKLNLSFEFGLKKKCDQQVSTEGLILKKCNFILQRYIMIEQAFPYNEYHNYLAGLISKILEYEDQVKVDNKTLRTMKEFYFSGTGKDDVQNFVSLMAKGDQENQQKLLNFFKSEGYLMREVFEKFKAIIKEDENDYEKELVLKDKFNTFLSVRLINEQNFFNIITKQFELWVNSVQLAKFFKKFKQIRQIEEQETFRLRVFEFFNQIKQFRQNFSEQVQEEIVSLVFQRKRLIQVTEQNLSSYDVENIQAFFTWAQNLSSVKVAFKTESEQQFKDRVLPIVQKHFKKLSKLNKQKVDLLMKYFFSRVGKQFDFQGIKSNFSELNLGYEEEKVNKMLEQMYPNRQKTASNDSPTKNQSSTNYDPSSPQKKDEGKCMKKIELRSTERTGQYTPQNGRNKKNFPIYVDEQQWESISEIHTNKQFSQKKQESLAFLYINQREDAGFSKTQINQPMNNQLLHPTSHPQKNQSKSHSSKSHSNPVNQQSSRINVLQEQIRIINSNLKNILCFETLVRKIDISITKNNQQQISSLLKSLEQMVIKYNLNINIQTQITEILDQNIKLNDKFAKIVSIRRKIEGLNLQEIFITKQKIQINPSCSGANGIILIGQTGAGKSTTMVGLCGHKLKYYPDSKDFRADDPKIAEQYKISNSMMSVTRWANVSELNDDWTFGEKINTIDTPGLDDNRGVEIDITNNIGTVKLLKTLQKGRILIVLSKKNFRIRWYDDFVRIIRSVSKYLVDIKSIKTSLTFVLTQELDAKTLLERLEEFDREVKARNSENWNQNEKEFIGFMMYKLRNLETSNQILNPSTHNFQILVQSILQISEKENIGKYIDTSFSKKAEEQIHKTFDYLKTMVEQTFLHEEFPLTKFYLNRILNLEQIYKERQEYQKSKENIKSLLRDKVNQIQNLKNQFLIYGIEKNLDLMKEKYNQLNSKENIEFFEFLYEINQKSSAKGESSPEERIELMNKKKELPNVKALQLINDQTRWVQNKISQFAIPDLNRVQLSEITAKNIEPADKKQIIYSLQLMRQFASEKEYKKILEQIQKHNQSVVKYFSGFLETEQIEDQDLEKIICLFDTRIQTQIEKVNNQSQRISKIYELIQTYFIKKCKEKGQISKFIEETLKISLDGLLLRKCDTYIKKLNLLKKISPFLVELVNSQLNWLTRQLDEKSAYLQDQIDSCTTQLDPKTLSMLETYHKNFNEINEISSFINKTVVRQLKWQKQQQTTFSKIEMKIKETIKDFWILIDQLSKQPEGSKFESVKESLKYIFDVLSFIKSMKNQDLTSKQQNNSRSIQMKMFVDTLKKFQNIINQIEQKIQQMSLRTKVSNYEINNKLIVCYLTIKQCEKYQQEKRNTAENIKKKLLAPFQSISSAQFNQYEDFEKLLLVLKYLKLFDEKIVYLNTKFEGFEDYVPLNESLLVKEIFVKAYEKLKMIHNEFKTIKLIDYLELKYITSDENVQQNPGFKNDQTSRVQMYHNNELLKKIADYIFKFNFIRKVYSEFKEELPVVSDHKRKIEEIDIQQAILKRVQNICYEMDSFKSPTKNKILTRQDQYTTLKEIQFTSKIFKSCDIKIQKYDLESLRSSLKMIIEKQHSDFDSLLKEASIEYKILKTGVDFENLKNIINHKISKDEKNKLQIKKLLNDINNQYIKSFISYYPQLWKNTEFLLNIAQFTEIITQSQIKIDGHKINNKDYQNKCNQYFNQLCKKSVQILKSLRVGGVKPQKEIQQIFLEEQKILKYLSPFYQDFKRKYKYPNQLNLTPEQKSIADSWYLREHISQSSSEIETYISNTYFKQQKPDFKITSQYRDVFQNTTPQNRQIMTDLYIKRCDKKMEQMQRKSNENHAILACLISGLQYQLQQIPTQIEKQVRQKFAQNKKKYQSLIKNTLKNVEKHANDEYFQGILQELNQAENKNNQQVKKYVISFFEKYLHNKKRQLNFSDHPKAEQILASYFQIMKLEKYKHKIESPNHQLKKIHENFITEVNKKLSTNNQQIMKDFCNYKSKLEESNSNSSFTIKNFVSQRQDSGIQAIIDRQKLLQKYSQLFEVDHSSMNAKMQAMINHQKDPVMKNLLDQIKTTIIQPLQMGKLDEFSKENFVNKIRSLWIEKQVFGALLQFSKSKNSNLSSFKKCIEDCEKIHLQLVTAINNRENELQNFDLQSLLASDTQDRLIAQFKQIEQTILKISSYFWVLDIKKVQSQDIIIKETLQLYGKKIQAFEKQTLDQIDSYFRQPSNEKIEKGRKYYFLRRLFSENKQKLKLFSSKIKSQNSIKNKILEKFNENINKIERFTKQGEKQRILNKWKQLLAEEDKLMKKVNYQLKNQEEKLEKQHAKSLKDLDQKTNNQISALSNLEAALIKTKTESIMKQHKYQKQCLINDYNQQKSMIIAQVQATNSPSKQEIISKITLFLNENILQSIIIIHDSKTRLDCEDKIQKHYFDMNSELKKIEQIYSKQFTKHIFNVLNENGNNICLSILDQYRIFKPFKASEFFDGTKDQTVEKLLDQFYPINKNGSTKSLLMERYQYLLGNYQSIIDKHKTCHHFEDSMNQYARQAIALGQKLKSQYHKNAVHSDDAIRLIAYIFGLWTIIESDVDEQKNVVYIYMPHAGQILSVFLLIGLEQDSPPQDIKRKIIQVSTGQGKSVVLGVLSAYLALVGFEVYEACFSQYLSERDFSEFKKLFQKLQVYNKIKYNTFPSVCKQMLNHDTKQPFANKIQSVLHSKNPSLMGKFLNLFKRDDPKKSQQANKRILLIDEADVFLDQNYIGQSYRPSIFYQTPQVEELLNYIWSLRQKCDKLDPRDIFKTSPFKKVIQNKNPIFGEIMQNQVHAIVRDLQNYDKDAFILLNGRIYYKQGDGITDKVRYGYRTLFTCLKLYEKRLIMKEQLDKNLGIHLVGASFSYTLLPEYFETILGVTGTLQSMNKAQKQILTQQFRLEGYTQPSIFPKSQRTISFLKCNNAELYSEIIKSIDSQHQNKRPVLVFFKTKSEVYAFVDSKGFEKYKKNYQIVTYEVSPKERDFRIKTATEQNKITLLTMDFARGTDFKMKTKAKDAKIHPGLHVIGAYLPDSFSDYIQLIGRTGRQGRRGSAMIIIAKDDPQLLKNASKLSINDGQNMIKQAEEKIWIEKKKEIDNKIIEVNKLHQQTVKIYNQSPKVDQIYRNLQKLNLQPEIGFYKSNTVIAIDGTGSMGDVFEKVKRVVNGAIPDIYESIKKSNVTADFLIKFVIYRNYGSGYLSLLQASNFFNKSQDLVNWLKTTGVSGGQGNQAIQVCLQYINSLEDVNQFIIIADAPANTKVQTIQKRGIHPQHYWGSHNFPLTTYEEELKRTKRLKIKGHSFYLYSRNKQFFDNLSKQTGGVSEEFKIDERMATKKFADFVSNQILNNLGEMIGGDAAIKLIQNYRDISSKKAYV